MDIVTKPQPEDELVFLFFAVQNLEKLKKYSTV